MKPQNYFSRLLAALHGRQIPAGDDRDRDAPSIAEHEARIAALTLDLQERDERIEAMRVEYAALAESKERALAGAGREELDRLFDRLARTLANMATLAALGEDGEPIDTADLIGLFRSLEKELAKAGLEPIGRVGQRTEFDVAAHQRMSGGAVHAGTPVRIELPGYRVGARILMKAMVSAAEDC